METLIITAQLAYGQGVWQMPILRVSRISAPLSLPFSYWSWGSLGRKATTNLYSMLKSRDITLPTKVHLVKVMVFPVVMYGCESWTVKKAERQRIDAFELRF